MRETRLRKHVPLLVVALLLLLVSGFIVVAGSRSSASPTRNPQSTTKPAGQQRVETYGKLPLTFEANRGQTDHRVKFLSHGSGYGLFLTSDEAVLSLRSQESAGRSQRQEKHARSTDDLISSLLPTPHSPLPAPQSPALSPLSQASEVLHMKLVGANTAAKVVGVEELPGKSNYFIGNDSKKWRTDVPTYAKVKYENVYPGIDLVYYGNQRQLEYDFVVAPGVDSKAIALKIETGDSKLEARNSKLEIAPNGDLVVQAEGGEVRFHKPVVYQPTADAANPKSKIQNRKLLDGRYVLTADNRVTFEIPNYDETLPLVIDPVLVYSTYLGGDPGSDAFGITVDSLGDAYVAGGTDSPDFPITNALQSTCCGAFITKFNPSGTQLVYSTYLGGSGGAGASAIAVDSSGSAYITGGTQSPDFPTLNPIQTCVNAAPLSEYLFAAKLSPAGNALLYSTCLGQVGGSGIAIDRLGQAYITGGTGATGLATVNAFQPNLQGFSNAIVMKLNAAGDAEVYSTYLGGSDFDIPRGIAVDSSGDAYVTGYTTSADFPTMNPFQAAHTGEDDAFVAKLNAAGTGLVYSTYLGGRNTTLGFGIAVDSSGNAYVAGYTDSADFPLVNPAQSQCVCGNGSTDAFVTKLNSAGNALVYSTYLGGRFRNVATSIALDRLGTAYVTGLTDSADFPILNAFQSTYGGGGLDGFVTELNATGNALVYSSFLGGSGADLARSVFVDSSGGAYVTGSTSSVNFPTVNALQSTLEGFDNAFVSKIASTIPFSSFSAKLEITPGPKPGFQMYANFTLGAGGSINPLTQPVTLQVGNYSVTVPPGSFKQLGQGSKAGSYVYSGTINGVSLQVHIVALGSSSYVFKATAQPVDLTGLSNPVSVTITIGNNSGTADVAAEFERRPAPGSPVSGGLGR